MNKFNKKRFRPAVCRLRSDEEPVQSGLAYTPSDMLQMASDGLPVSTQTYAMKGQMDMGYRTLEFEPPAWDLRHADFADLWEKDKDARMRLKKAAGEAQRKEVVFNA